MTTTAPVTTAVPAKDVWTRFATTDLDEAIAFFQATFLDLSIRRQSGQATELRTATAYLAPETTLTRMHYTIHTDMLAEPERDLNIDLVLAGRLSLHDQGRHSAATRGGVLLLPPDRALSAEFDGLNVLTVHLPRHLIDDVAVAATGIDPAHLRFDGAAPIGSATHQQWQQALTYIQRGILDDPATASNPLLLQQAERLLATIVLTGWANTSQHTRPIPRPYVPPAVVRRAMNYIQENAHRPVTIAQIAEAAGVSPRALQQAFRRHHDTTPTAYARRIRLEHAHHDLLAGDLQTGDTVGAIAARWGFANTSRFSTDYSAHYGQSPGHTLRS
jgi:AraC-like DNA-binding protein